MKKNIIKAISLFLSVLTAVGVFAAAPFSVGAAEASGKTNSWDVNGDGKLKILSIGNSFAHDSLEYAQQLIATKGIDAEIDYLYMGGCDINYHWEAFQNDKASYQFRYYKKPYWAVKEPATIMDALNYRRDGGEAKKDYWDYILFQQASPTSGVADSYSHLEELVDGVREVVGEKPKFLWLMTWAYAEDYPQFANELYYSKYYGSNQMTMYNSILNAYQSEVVPLNKFDGVIPSGTAIQNARTSYLNNYRYLKTDIDADGNNLGTIKGYQLTHDGLHLSRLGQYISNLTVIKAITGISPEELPTTFGTGRDGNRIITAATDEEKEVISECVNNAVAEPLKITQSMYDGKEYKLGDPNGDGKIDLDDAIFAAEAAVGNTALNDKTRKSADVNGDGEVTIHDALLIARLVSGVIDKLPVLKTR